MSYLLAALLAQMLDIQIASDGGCRVLWSRKGTRLGRLSLVVKIAAVCIDAGVAVARCPCTTYVHTVQISLTADVRDSLV